MRSSRGEVVSGAIFLYVIIGLALTQLVPNWRVTHWFQKGPPITQLAASQAKLDKAKAEALAAQALADKAKADEAARVKTEVQDGQQMVAGASKSLKEAPNSPQVALATQFLDRASLRLSKAVGDLPADKQAEIIDIVDKALSGMQAKVDEANAAILAKDKAFAVTQAEKEALAKQVPALQSKADAKEKEISSIQAVVTTQTAQIVAYAAQAVKDKEDAGSFLTWLKRLAWVLGGLVAFVIAKDIWLPSVAQSYPHKTWLQRLNSFLTNTTTTHILAPAGSPSAQAPAVPTPPPA